MKSFLLGSSCLCVLAYLLAALSPWPLLALAGCGLCGFSVGIMWPGVFNMATIQLPKGGTAMFGLLALGGDVGCAAGPALAGTVAGAFSGELKAGLLAAIVFPALMVLLIPTLRSDRK